MKIYKFSKIFNFLPKSKIKAGDGKKEGKYPLYTSSPILSKYYNEYLYEYESLVFGTGGQPSLHYVNNKFSTSTDCFTVKKKDEFEKKVHTKYIYYFFKSNKKILEDGFKGAGLKHISKRYLSNINIPLPKSIDDQIKIANLLSQVEALIAKRKESIKLLDELLKSTFLDMFGDPVLNPNDWDTNPLEEIVTDDCPITYGIVQPGEEFIDGVPIVRPVDLSIAPLEIKNLKRIDPKISKKFDRTLLNGDELLLTVRGTVGDIGLATKELKGVNVTRGITPLRFLTDVDKTFYYYQLKSKPIQNKIQTYVKGAALRQINLKDLRKLELIVPNENIVINFAKKANQIESMKLSYVDSLCELNELFGSLSQRAFHGKLDLGKMITVEVSDATVPNVPSSGVHRDIKKPFTQTSGDQMTFKDSKPNEEDLITLIKVLTQEACSFETLHQSLLLKGYTIPYDEDFDKLENKLTIKETIFKLLKSGELVQEFYSDEKNKQNSHIRLKSVR